MSRFAQGIYKPKNPNKYIGRGLPKYRSSWELSAFRTMDEHPSILQWASESIMIPYKDPVTNKKKNYIPDLFIIFKDRTGEKKAEILEIKPSGQTGMKKTRSLMERAVITRNQAKWAAAMAYCAKQGIGFRVITEKDLFRGTK